ncbi:MAG: GHMP kinase [Bacteroidetes bacterium]|jgi:glucuronokinase|nr:GHMP kinase [Bacteroidota bacterium]
MIIESRAFARAGLLGNPSDGYFGKTISVIIRNFGARISLYETPELEIEEQEVDRNKFRNVYQLLDSVKQTGYYGGSRLVKATIKKFTEYCEHNQIKLGNKNFTVRYQSSIPRQVGLAGSSAIVTATMRALMRFYNIQIPNEILPGLCLEVETQELGINAGLQDRVIQAYEGCVYMDFDKNYFNKHGYGKYIPLDPNKLPKLYLAYKTQLSKVSGQVLNNIRERYEAGDSETIDTLHEIASLADEGKKAIENGNYASLNKLINKNFDLRCKIMNISESNHELVMTARNCGASAKFSGSGGAIIGIYEDDEMLQKLIVNLKKINARVIKPYMI